MCWLKTQVKAISCGLHTYKTRTLDVQADTLTDVASAISVDAVQSHTLCSFTTYSPCTHTLQWTFRSQFGWREWSAWDWQRFCSFCIALGSNKALLYRSMKLLICWPIPVLGLGSGGFTVLVGMEDWGWCSRLFNLIVSSSGMQQLVDSGWHPG